MTTITVKCDSCGDSWEDLSGHRQLWNLHVNFACAPQEPHGYQYEKSKKTQWCRPCMVKAGVLGSKEEKSELPAEVKPLSIEELIRAIIHEEMENK